MEKEEAISIMKAGLGKADGELAASFVSPFYWIWPDSAGGIGIRNGSMFFLDCGGGCFAVTAAHVYEGYLSAKGAHARLVCQVGDVPFDPAAALIDWDLDMDIATFRFSAAQVREAGKVVMTGCQPSWPPYPPQVDRGVVFAGFPGVERQRVARRAISWGIYTAGTVASSVSERDVSCAFERDNWIDVMGSPCGDPSASTRRHRLPPWGPSSARSRDVVRNWELQRT